MAAGEAAAKPVSGRDAGFYLFIEPEYFSRRFRSFCRLHYFARRIACKIGDVHLVQLISAAPALKSGERGGGPRFNRITSVDDDHFYS